MNNLNKDLIFYIFLLLNKKDKCKFKFLNKKFHKLYLINNNKKLKMIIKKWINIKKTRYISRKKFIYKLLNDIEFRNYYLFIHQDPYPHICLKNKLGPYFVKLFPNREDIINFVKKEFSNYEIIYQNLMDKLKI